MSHLNTIVVRPIERLLSAYTPEAAPDLSWIWIAGLAAAIIYAVLWLEGPLRVGLQNLTGADDDYEERCQNDSRYRP